ncbi:MAG: aldehyde dehydrogenase family protein, partial [Bacteroidia bacterium]|nr:aldehyde dehydrogenase family protein [Bacteroidia bacterium]
MEKVLKALGIKDMNVGCSTGKNYFANGDVIESYSPVDGKLIAKVKAANAADYEKVVQVAGEAFKSWRLVPAPKRGE